MDIKVVGVIPVHSHEKWVAGAVLSMARQTYKPTAIVVVDDGSTDGSAQAVRGLLTDGMVEGVPLHLLHNACPLGPAAARNVGARYAARYSPHLFAFLDSDDEYKPRKIEKSVEAWKLSEGGIGVVYSDFSTVNNDGEVRRRYQPPFSLELLRRECIINCDSLVSREAFEWCQGFPEHLRVAEDYSAWLRLTRKYLAYHVAESLVTIRIGGHSSSSQISPERWQRDYRAAFVWAGLLKE